MCLCIYAFTQMSELVSQLYIFLYSCCIFGDTFKNTGCYYTIIYLNFDRSCVGKSTGFEVVPPNYTGIDHYVVCSWLNVAKKRWPAP